MPIRRMHANFKVTNNAGRIALMRGPLVYALETTDNPGGIANMVLAADGECRLVSSKGLPEGTLAIEGCAWLESCQDEGRLYFEGEMERRAVSFTAIPYFLWQNRGPCHMAVWMRSE